MNPIQLLSMLKGAQDPQKVLSMLAQQNPQMAQAIHMTNEACKDKNSIELEEFAKNLANQSGIDLNDLKGLF